MFDGIGFLFPKLAFLLFFFLGCETLCPLKNTAIYFPRLFIFEDLGLKRPIWMWIAKWGMIVMAILALMSPVKEISSDSAQGYDLLVVIDPQDLKAESLNRLETFLQKRDADRIGLWALMEHPVVLPMSEEHKLIYPVLKTVHPEKNPSVVDRSISRFFEGSEDQYRWVLIMSDRPEKFVFSLPPGLHADVIGSGTTSKDFENLDEAHPAILIRGLMKYYEYYYFYPLFGSFLFMLLYLYGRNQKGMR